MPEVQAHAERLAADFSGAELTSFRPLHMAALKTYEPGPDTAVGRKLFDGATDYETYKQLRNVQIPPLRPLRPDAPRGLVSVLNRAMAARPVRSEMRAPCSMRE